MANCRICNSAETKINVSLDVSGAVAGIAFCADCARKFDMDVAALERKGLPEFIGRCKAFSDSGEDPSLSINCPNCGLSGEQVVESGKAGCAFCYVVFRDLPVHKGASMGRRLDSFELPDCTYQTESPEILERRLHEAVSEEDYETAARIRDRLRNANLSADES